MILPLGVLTAGHWCEKPITDVEEDVTARIPAEYTVVVTCTGHLRRMIMIRVSWNLTVALQNRVN